MAMLVVLLAELRGVRIAFESYAGHFAIAALMAGTSWEYRRWGRSPEISATLANCAILIAFTNIGATLNYLLLRPGAVPADHLLMQVDAVLGFDWLSFVGYIAEFPTGAPALAWVYKSSLAQMVAMILYLGLSRRQVELHQFVLVGVLCGTASLIVFTIMPSIGPAPFNPLAPDVAQRLEQVVDTHYQRELLGLFNGVPTVLSSDRLIGLIAFPSMHTVMAAMSVFYARGTRLFVPMVLLNTLMIPAIIAHGGHHLVDVIGGVAVFAVAAVCAAKLVRCSEDQSLAPAHAQTASGGRLIRMASILPPVLRPNSVPRS